MNDAAFNPLAILMSPVVNLDAASKSGGMIEFGADETVETVLFRAMRNDPELLNDEERWTAAKAFGLDNAEQLDATEQTAWDLLFDGGNATFATRKPLPKKWTAGPRWTKPLSRAAWHKALNAAKHSRRG